MAAFGSVDETLDFAISEERQAEELYSRLAAEARNPGMRRAFEQFAAEEAAHREKLEGVKATKSLLAAHRKVTELSVTDYFVGVDTSPSMGYQEALLLAMQKEKAAYRMYTDLAAATEDGALKELLLALAHEEANHKLRFELEYDTYVSPEN